MLSTGAVQSIVFLAELLDERPPIAGQRPRELHEIGLSARIGRVPQQKPDLFRPAQPASMSASLFLRRHFFNFFRILASQGGRTGTLHQESCTYSGLTARHNATPSVKRRSIGFEADVTVYGP